MTLLAVSSAEVVFAQQRGELEKKRQNIIEQIKIAQEQLATIKADKKTTLSELQALQAKLAARQALIQNINQEISALDQNIVQSSSEVMQLSQKLEHLKTSYAQSVRYSFENRSSASLIAFLFSSSSYNDAITRLKYIRKLRGYRMDKVEDIRSTQQVIEKKINELNAVKTQKSVLKNVEEMQKSVIEKEKNETNKIVTTLQGQESALISSIEKNKKSAKKLDAAINQAIKREIELAQKKAAEEERKKREAARLKQIQDEKAKQAAALKAKQEADRIAAAKAAANKPVATSTKSTTPTPNNTTVAKSEPVKSDKTYGSGANAVKLNTGSGSVTAPKLPEPTSPEAESDIDGKPKEIAIAKEPVKSFRNTLTPEAVNLANSFEANKGKLPWPVDRGIITGSFGTHKHAVAQRVMVDNNGIDIQANPGAAVRTVFDGTVTSIFSVPGRGNVVLVSHGVYFTVYSQLATVNVAKGSQVKTKQTIGTVGTNEDGESIMNFQVWKVGTNNNTSKMNPESWIAR